jgi:hypothetical protein
VVAEATFSTQDPSTATLGPRRSHEGEPFRHATEHYCFARWTGASLLGNLAACRGRWDARKNIDNVPARIGRTELVRVWQEVIGGCSFALERKAPSTSSARRDASDEATGGGGTRFPRRRALDAARPPTRCTTPRRLVERSNRPLRVLRRVDENQGEPGRAPFLGRARDGASAADTSRVAE